MFHVDSIDTNFVPIGAQKELESILKVCVPIELFSTKSKTFMGVYLTS